MTRKLICLLVYSLCALNFSFAYTVILKNGKTIQGTLVSENSDMYVLKDASGIQLNFKKTAVDAEKTLSANQAVQTTVPSAKPDSPPKSEAKPQPAALSKKAARTFTEEDLQRLREKYNLGGGRSSTSDEADDSNRKDQTEKKAKKDQAHSAEDFRAQAGELQNEIKQAEDAYANLKQGCDFAAKMTTQSGTATNEKGQRLSISDTRKEVCDAAENAKTNLDNVREQYQTLIDSAKSEGISQDWLESQ